MFLLQAILMNIFPFYRVDFPINLLPKNFVYIEYSKISNSKELIIKEGDTTYTLLRDFIFKEKEGWSYDLTTYAPNKTFNSSKMKINYTNNFLIVNYENKNNEWTQISKKCIENCTFFFKKGSL